MDKLKKDNAARFKKQFSRWDKALTAAKLNSLEALYKKVHQAIRQNPKRVKAARKDAAVRKQISKEKGSLVLQNSKGKKWLRQFKLTRVQRKERVAAKIQRALQKK
jgi:hypothetical protein